MGTYNPNYESIYNLLRGLRGLILTAITGVIRTLNLQAGVTGVSFPASSQASSTGPTCFSQEVVREASDP